MIAIAMHEQDRRHIRSGGRGLRQRLETQGLKSEGPGQQRQGAGAFQDRSPR
jgi:hypothetical protein